MNRLDTRYLTDVGVDVPDFVSPFITVQDILDITGGDFEGYLALVGASIYATSDVPAFGRFQAQVTRQYLQAHPRPVAERYTSSAARWPELWQRKLAFLGLWAIHVMLELEGVNVSHGYPAATPNVSHGYPDNVIPFPGAKT